MPDTTNRQKYRTPGAAQYLGISASTLEKLRVVGGGPVYLKLGGAVVYDPDAWLADKRRQSTSAPAGSRIAA